ncbi:hypothetical protein CDAR_558661 [Caerostris darwini]|uniref:Uncharacterized protein n=1 Tax=Caerostris darwini TaxID=1538125 RepID=A0AAV4VNC2_9ARAC|nr:hypothetical protein CDAR_558661 [Caerostris darwini]
MRKRYAPESGLLGYETIASAVAWQQEPCGRATEKSITKNTVNPRYDYAPKDGQQVNRKIDALRTVHNDRTNKFIQAESEECYQLL